MKTKHRLLSLLMLGAIIAILAYSAGARHNQLSSQQMRFSSLSSNQNQNQLKAHMRDALISKLNTRASNHELRIATYAQSSSHHQLNPQQLSFNSYLSTHNNNLLTAQMWDNLTTQFGNAISNHEMRIRCIEDGSCLNTSHCPSTPSSEEFHCVGSYQDDSSGNQVCIQDTKKTDPHVKIWYSPFKQCLEDIALGKISHHLYGGIGAHTYCEVHYEFPGKETNTNIFDKKRYIYPFSNNPYDALGKDYIHRGINLGDNQDIVRCQIATYPKGNYKCNIDCERHSIRNCDMRRCKLTNNSTSRNCNQLNQNACINQTGCSRVKK